MKIDKGVPQIPNGKCSLVISEHVSSYPDIPFGIDPLLINSATVSAQRQRIVLEMEDGDSVLCTKKGGFKLAL